MDYLIDLKKQDLSGKTALEGGISLGVDTDGNIKKIDESGAISDIGGSIDESRLLPETGSVSSDSVGNPVIFKAISRIDNTYWLCLPLNEDTNDRSTCDVATGVYGTVNIVSNAPSSPGGSAFFNGSSCLHGTLPAQFGTSDFTVRFWMMAPGMNSSTFPQTIFSTRRGNETSGSTFGLHCQPDGNLSIYSNTDITPRDTAPFKLQAGVWYHVAVVRKSGVATIYVDGKVYASGSFTNSLTRQIFGLGASWTGSSYSEAGTFYLTSLDVLNYAAYDGAFTTPAYQPGILAGAGYEVATDSELKDMLSAAGIDESRLLPENPANGDIPCYSNEPPVGVNYNDANTVLLLQGSSDNTAAAATSERLNGIVTGEFPVQEDGSILVNGTSNYITFNDADTRRVFSGEFTLETYIKTTQFTASGKRQDTNWCVVYRNDTSSVTAYQWLLLSDFYADAGKFGIWPYPQMSGETFPKTLINAEFQHVAIDVYMVDGVRKFTMYRNGVPYHTGNYWSTTPADWSSSVSAAMRLFGEGTSGGDDYLSNASVMSLRVSNIARYKGVSFDPPADGKYLNPPAGYWGKLNKNELVQRVNGQTPDSSGAVTIPAATASAAGLMAAADKAAIAGLTARGIYPVAGSKTGAVDFNEVIDHGFYFIGGDTPHLNYPETYAQNGGTLQVIRSGAYLTQTFIPIVSQSMAFIRHCINVPSDLSNRTFSTWRRLLTDADITESKVRPGYFKLPGGIIVQWGAVLNITADGTTSATLPIAFPNSAFVATATATGSGLIASAAFDGNSKLNVIVKGYPGSGSFTVYWIAIGY